MIRKMGYQWHLRRLMAERELFQTTDLGPLLAERGVSLSREQVFRLVTRPPQRLSMDVLSALCNILDCTPNDLIEVQVVKSAVKKAVSSVLGRHHPCGAPQFGDRIHDGGLAQLQSRRLGSGGRAVAARPSPVDRRGC
jgi:DNA-binding Xre family transcriptional regulator